MSDPAANKSGSLSDGDSPVPPINQVTLLFTLHPALLPSFCRRKGTFPGNESEGKKLHSNAIHSANDFSSSKRLPTSLHNLRTQIPQLSGGKLTNAPAHLTRHNLLENSTERGNPMNRKPVKAAHREKENNTCSSPTCFLHLRFALTNHRSFVYKVLTPIQLTQRPLPIKFVVLLSFDQKLKRWGTFV